jgi:formate--tetrahydrofolate ligase
MNDRALRQTEIGLGGKTNGIPRSESFTITAASEIMAILCLSENLADLKKRLGKIVIGEDEAGAPVLARDIKAVGAMCAILRDAVKPNLVQTLEHTPALVHGGPFANIAHGTSSVIAAKTALSLADYVITEAGFGADLGAEKFFDIFGRQTGLFPDCVVAVATIRALKMHGGVSLANLQDENLAALQRGFENLKAHLLNLQLFGITPIVALNAFSTDTKEETDLLLKLCRDMQVQAFVSNGWKDGSKGCITLAEEVINVCKNTSPHVNLLYQDNDTLYNKIRTIAQKIYHAKDVSLTAEAEKTLAKFTHWGYDKLPVCIAKTQNSLSHDKNLLGAPEGYTLPISEVRLSAGAGFVVVLTGNINTMPGLPEHPAAEAIDTDSNGNIIGLF